MLRFILWFSFWVIYEKNKTFMTMRISVNCTAKCGSLLSKCTESENTSKCDWVDNELCFPKKTVTYNNSIIVNGKPGFITRMVDSGRIQFQPCTVLSYLFTDTISSSTIGIRKCSLVSDQCTWITMTYTLWVHPKPDTKLWVCFFHFTHITSQDPYHA